MVPLVVGVLCTICIYAPLISAWMRDMPVRAHISAKHRWTRVAVQPLVAQPVLLSDGPRFVFVGGKGGVGKTTSSSAIAIASSDKGLRTLLVSTDPAHSLGDSLAANLSSGLVVPITTEQSLWALEVDVASALEEFRSTLGGFDSAGLAASLGLPKELVQSLGINEIADIFSNPPPGIDEVLALAKIFQYADSTEASSNGKAVFDRVVVDTAPTGHTLRLLQLPQFLDTLTVRLIRAKAKLTSAVSAFKGLFGGNDRNGGGSGGHKVLSLLDKLDTLQSSIQRVQRILRDQAQTQFVVVTIPTAMAVAETQRLVTSLSSEGIAIASIICNQVLSPQAGGAYLRNRARGQQQCLRTLKNFVAERGAGISVTEVQLLDTEATGVYGLRYFAALAHPQSFDQTGQSSSDAASKLTIFGGKGGVGKTTSAASYAVQLADSGLRTLVISADPAHSLGDALQVPLAGSPTRIETPGGMGELWAMEIDPAQALAEFKRTVDDSIKNNMVDTSKASGGLLGALGLPDFTAELSELLLGVQEPPPGTDEIIALTRVVDYLDQDVIAGGKIVRFDRVVLDTAPTGHTLHMLQLPEFMLQLTSKLRALRQRTSSLSNMMGGTDSAGKDAPGEMADATDKLASFERHMRRLQEILHNPAICEFTAVTIPTELAVAETLRLLDALQQEKVGVRRLIINQVIAQDTDTSPASDCAVTSYLNKVRAGQERSLQDLRTMSATSGASLIEVPYFDTEVRTVYGLRLVSNVLFPKN